MPAAPVPPTELAVPTPLADLAARIEDRLAHRDRVLVGVVGEPGAGKSTLTAAVAAYLHDHGHDERDVTVVPMDGFHLANVELARLGRADRKGAIDTFDGHGYVNLLLRLRANAEDVVYAPTYDRSIEESVAGAVAVPRRTRVVLTEGNYLLADAEPWREVPMLLDEVWYADVDPALRRERLVARHVAFGKDPARAAAWVDEVDERNAERIRATRDRATLVVTVA